MVEHGINLRVSGLANVEHDCDFVPPIGVGHPGRVGGLRQLPVSRQSLAVAFVRWRTLGTGQHARRYRSKCTPPRVGRTGRHSPDVLLLIPRTQTLPA